ncbi:hypothetical protein EMPS_08467 [Entomortierella parvispora]|uniref:Secreted protein n=1 Tax=Entomortierella parvispora TaxID=205924 RepID=A0A9P3HGF2_9FUNG|nr:hypothetical protein EMPS_08467 [Entomortierella parvispora]
MPLGAWSLRIPAFHLFSLVPLSSSSPWQCSSEPFSGSLFILFVDLSAPIRQQLLALSLLSLIFPLSTHFSGRHLALQSTIIASVSGQPSKAVPLLCAQHSLFFRIKSGAGIRVNRATLPPTQDLE